MLRLRVKYLKARLNEVKHILKWDPEEASEPDGFAMITTKRNRKPTKSLILSGKKQSKKVREKGEF